MDIQQFIHRLLTPLKKKHRIIQKQPIESSTSPAEDSEKRKAKIKLFQQFKAWAAIATLSFIGQLPRPISLWIGARLGDAFYFFNKKRRKIAQKNLEICFPDWPVEKRYQVARSHFRLYGQAVADLGMLWLASEQRLNNLLKVHGLEHWHKVTAEGKPAILFTPHFVTVDIGFVLSRYAPICSMMKEQSNPVFSKRLRTGRLRFGTKVYNRSDGIRPLIKNLLNNVSCYYIPDGDFGLRSSVFVPFFGVPAATLTTLGRMARITKAVAIPVHSLLNSETGQYNLHLGKPLENFPSEQDYDNARRMNSEFETMINGSPEHYMWTIPWFRTRPDNGPSLY